MEISNPWDVEDLDIYLRYNCPQCDAKCETKDMFVNHAIDTHPEAKEVLQDQNSFCEVQIKEEAIDWDYCDESYENVKEEDEEEKPLKVKKPKKPKKEPKEPAVDKEGEVQCYRCGDLFNFESKVKQHIRENHSAFVKKDYFGPKRQYQCHACNCMCETTETLSSHTCKFTKTLKFNVFNCEVCKTEFSSKRQLDLHNMSLHVTEQFFCDKCDFKCKSAHLLYDHKKKHHEMVRNSICHLCGKGFVSVAVLNTHYQTVHPKSQSTYICDKCGAEYHNIGSFKRHQQQKHPNYTLCTFCQVLCRSRLKLKLHLMKQHNIKTEVKQPYFCWKCSKNLLTLKDLDEHLVAEHEFKADKSQCQLCDKSFSSKITLKAHVVDKHDLDKLKSSKSEFACQLFGIVKEEPKNTGEFACQFCEKRFHYQRTLAVHIKEFHDKSNHIKCKYCDFSSFQPYRVKKHEERTHLKLTNFECDLCPFKCYAASQLKKHKRTVHEKKKQFACQECDQEFFKKEQIVQHLLEEHNIIYQTD